MAHLHSVYDTDTHFLIDGVTRAVKNASNTKMMVVQHDHNSERFTFEIPRMIDGHDMSTCNVVQVHYINIDSQTKEQTTGVYEVDDLQISPDGDDVVICSWLISANATHYVGNLSFIVRFVCSAGGDVDYAWNTAIHSNVYVSKGIFNGDVVAEEYADVLVQFAARMGELEKMINGNGQALEELGSDVADMKEVVQELERIDLGYFDSSEEVLNKMDELTTTGKYRLRDDAYVYYLDVERVTDEAVDYVAQYYWNTDEGCNKVYSRFVDYETVNTAWSDWEPHNAASGASVFYVNVTFEANPYEGGGYTDCITDKTIDEIREAIESGKVVKARLESNIYLDLAYNDDGYSFTGIVTDEYTGMDKKYIHDLIITGDNCAELYLTELGAESNADDGVFYINATQGELVNDYADCTLDKVMSDILTAHNSGRVIKAKLGTMILDLVNVHEAEASISIHFSVTKSQAECEHSPHDIYDLYVMDDRDDLTYGELYVTRGIGASGGGSGEWELLEDITLTEDVDSITITVPKKLKRLLLQTDLYSADTETTYNLRIACNYTWAIVLDAASGLPKQGIAPRAFNLYVEDVSVSKNQALIIYGTPYNNTLNSGGAASMKTNTKGNNLLLAGTKILLFSQTSGIGILSGGNVKLWGVSA